MAAIIQNPPPPPGLGGPGLPLTDPPPPPGLEHVFAAFGSDMAGARRGFAKVSPVIDEANVNGEPASWVTDLRKVVFSNADKMLQEKAAEMWYLMRERMSEAEQDSAKEVASLREEIQRCKDENRRLQEDTVKTKLELERLSAVEKLLVHGGMCAFQTERHGTPQPPFVVGADFASPFPASPFPASPFPASPFPSVAPVENRRLSEDGPMAKPEVEQLSLGKLLDFGDMGAASPFSTAPPFPLPAFRPSGPPPPGLDRSPAVAFQVPTQPMMNDPSQTEESTVPPSSPCSTGTTTTIPRSPMPPPCSPPPRGRQVEAPQVPASPGPLMAASLGGAALREATPPRSKRLTLGLPKTPTGRVTPKRSSLMASPTPFKSPLPQPSPFVICETGGCFFSFTLRKADGVALGLHMTRTEDNKAWCVDGVGAGTAVDAWNRQCNGSSTADKAVLVGDKLLSVNGRTDCDGMLEECKLKALLKFVITRGDTGCDIPSSWMESFTRDPRCHVTPKQQSWGGPKLHSG